MTTAAASRVVELDGHRLTLTSLDRVLWPSTGFTKGDMVDYYMRIAPVMLPHLAGRPLMFGRWPEGWLSRGWGQFSCRGHPEWMTVHPYTMRDGERVELCGVDQAAALVWIANQGGVELHPYLARAPDYHGPIGVVFDLDPGPPAGAAESARVALLVRDELAGAGLTTVVKTSGGSGLHVWLPLNTSTRWGAALDFARAIAARLAQRHPDLVTDTVSRAGRAGRVFIDWAQNGERRQTVAPYSLRMAVRPSVSTPLEWHEVAEAAQHGNDGGLTFGPADVLARVERVGDPFGSAAHLEQRLPR